LVGCDSRSAGDIAGVYDGQGGRDEWPEGHVRGGFVFGGCVDLGELEVGRAAAIAVFEIPELDRE
jgi:hypothetical protein